MLVDMLISKNFHIWGKENPHIILQKLIHLLRVNVWCGVWNGGIIGPYVSVIESGASSMVNGIEYPLYVGL